jgi:uncharacterized protein YaaN involved in tellurite resistance
MLLDIAIFLIIILIFEIQKYKNELKRCNKIRDKLEEKYIELAIKLNDYKEKYIHK